MGKMQNKIAEIAGVSPSTVSRAFTKNAHVHPDTLKKIRDAMTQLGLDSSSLANQGRDIFSNYVLIVADSLLNYHTSAIVDSICKRLSSQGYRAVLSLSYSEPAHTLKAIKNAVFNGYYGVISLSTSVDNALLNYYQTQQKIPLVFANQYIRSLDSDIVRCDHYQGACLATEHLVKHGHKRIVFLGEARENSTTQDQLRGFIDTVTSHRLITSKDDICLRSHSFVSGTDMVAELLAKGVSFTAIISSCNSLAVEAAEHLQSIHKELPQDCSIVTLEPSADGHNFVSVGCSPDSIGAEACSLLYRRAFDPRGEKELILLPADLRNGNSVYDRTSDDSDLLSSVLWIN